MINLVLFGPPGSGKGTQAQNLVQRYQFKQISTGDLFRGHMKSGTPLGKLASSYIDKGELVPDSVTINMLKESLMEKTNASGFIFDGFPRTCLQAESLDKLIEQLLGERIDIVLSLSVDDKILVERLLNRGKLSGRSDDSNEDIIRNRIREYYEKTSPVADFYKNQNKYIEVKGTGDIDEISKELYKEIDTVLEAKG